MTASFAVGFVNACLRLPVNARPCTAGQSGRPYCRPKSASSRPVSSKRTCGRIGPVLNLPLRHPVGELMLDEPLRVGIARSSSVRRILTSIDGRSLPAMTPSSQVRPTEGFEESSKPLVELDL